MRALYVLLSVKQYAPAARQRYAATGETAARGMRAPSSSRRKCRHRQPRSASAARDVYNRYRRIVNVNQHAYVRARSSTVGGSEPGERQSKHRARRPSSSHRHHRRLAKHRNSERALLKGKRISKLLNSRKYLLRGRYRRLIVLCGAARRHISHVANSAATQHRRCGAAFPRRRRKWHRKLPAASSLTREKARKWRASASTSYRIALQCRRSAICRIGASRRRCSKLQMSS